VYQGFETDPVSVVEVRSVWGEGIYAADTSSKSLIVNLWIYATVPITALNTKESGNTDRDVLADARLAKSRDEFELSLSSG
jgi:hypothetical protein